VTRVHVPSVNFRPARDVFVWLPDVPTHPQVRYPVLVFPDAEESGQFRAALANIQFLIDRQLIPPMLVVGIPYVADRTHELSPAATGSTAKLYPTAGGADQNLAFMNQELLPWIDAHYPTAPTRVLAGHSLGGLFALYAMAQDPARYRVVISMSAALMWNDGATSAELASRIAADSHPRTLFLMSGGTANGGLEAEIDRTTNEFASRLTVMLDSSHSHALRFEHREYPSDGHSMTPVPGLIDGLRMAFAPTVVSIDSVIQSLASRDVRDSAEIRAVVDSVESRYTSGMTALGLEGMLPEGVLDNLGAYALESRHPGLAAQILRENRDRYPASSNAHESYAEALAALQDTTAAAREFRTAITLATGHLRTATSIIARTRERRVVAAATEGLQAMHKADAHGVG
jgi:predicted alpha/beta superfamily hydrolase